MTSSAGNARWRRYLRFLGPNVEADVDEELRFHLEMRARDYEARGLRAGDAIRAAYERFGDYDAVNTTLLQHDHSRVRAQHRRDIMDDLKQDLRYALRSLRRAPGFALVAIITLALGIGANTAVFSVVDSLIVRSLPYPDAGRLTAVSGSTLAEFTRIRELNRSFTDVAAYRAASVNLSGDREPERLDGALVSPNLFTTLGIPASLGRAFAGDESQTGRIYVVLLSHALWTRRYAADPRIVGKPIMVEGKPYTVIGVMPRDFGFPTRDTQIWLPINMPPPRSGALWGSGGFRLVARLRAGVTPEQAQAETRALYRQIGQENPIWNPGPEYGAKTTVTALQQQLVGSARTMLFLLLGVVAMVLLIACANVANLLLVRANGRQKEVAVRMALGGSRGRLVRQFMTESAVLAALGGIVGVGVAWIGVRELLVLLPSDIPRVTRIAIDYRVLAFTTLLVVVTGVAFGLLPALRTSDVHPALRDGTRTSASGSHRRLTRLLVAGEIAAAVLLLIGATLLIRSATALQQIDPGFRVESIMTARITPPRGRFTDPQTLVPFFEQIVAHAAAIPGVASAAAVDRVPLSTAPGGSIALRIEGQKENLRSELPMIEHYLVVTPRYLETMGIPVVAGRGFTASDRSGAPEVAVVSESFARQFWPRGDAIGKRVGYPWPSDWMTIVGIVKDARIDSLSEGANQALYRPHAQAPALNMSLVLRTQAQTADVSRDLRRAVAEVDAGTPVSDILWMRTIRDRSAARQRFATLLLTLFAGIALTLGVVGIYGVMSYAVTQRQREIGIRMALGASPGDARGMVLGEGVTIAAGGIVVGLGAALIATRLLGTLLYHVSATDPVTFTAVPVLLAVVALLASYLPARRATRVDPTTALRAD